MRTPILALAALMAATPAPAQQRGPMQPLPDHWLTWDSVTSGLALTDAQLVDVGTHYEALNAVMKTAAEQRSKMRGTMRGMRDSGPPPDAMRERMQAMRAKMDSLQTEVDGHYQAIRNALTEEQQTKFDSLPRPMVAMLRRR